MPNRSCGAVERVLKVKSDAARIAVIKGAPELEIKPGVKV